MFNNIPTITKNLIILNLILFVGKILLMSTGLNLDVLIGGFYPESVHFKSYQIISHLFSNDSSILGLFFYLFFGLFMFGSTIERILGPKKYVTLFFASGIGAYLIFCLFIYFAPQFSNDTESINFLKNYPILGNYAAIYGFLVCYAMLMPDAKLAFIFIPAPIKAKYYVPAIILITLAIGLYNFKLISIINIVPLFGAIMGIILMKIWEIKKI